MAPAWLGGCSSDDKRKSPPSGDGGVKDSGVERRMYSNIANIEPLLEPDENGLRLPPGFTGRVVARSGEPVNGGSHVWHASPDGGATFPTEDGGYVYVSNAELPGTGGVGVLRFDAEGNVVDAYSILSNTLLNCAGGATPWRTWLSCEEVPRGRVFECDPFGVNPAVERPALGILKHEAAAVDPENQHIYLTEDEGDGRFYRFVPDQLTSDGFADLTAGRLEVAVVDESGNVEWLAVPDPTFSGEVPTRQQVPESTPFRGGEGIWYHAGVVFFSTKGDDRVWAYDIDSARLDVIYDIATSDNPILRGVDNLTVTCCGDVLVAEDGGDMEIVAILPDGSLKALIQIVGHPASEVTGPAFDPSGTRLYFSSQRGASGMFLTDGVTYEVTGPFHVFD